MRRQPCRAALVLAFLLLPALAGAQESSDPDLAVPPIPRPPRRGLTLRQALALADREATDLEVLRLQVARSEAAERIAWAGLLPVIEGVVSYQRFDEPIQRAGVGVVRDANQVTAQVAAREIFSLRTVSAVRMAEAASDTNRANLEDARRLAHGSIGRLFFGVLAARRAADLTRTQIADAVRLWNAARARHQLGAGIRLDADRAEVAALDALRRAADADAALERAWDQLGYALGLGEPIEARESTLPRAPIEVQAALERAESVRSDVRAAEAEREQAGRALDDAWFRFAPILSVSWTGTLTFPTTLFNPDAAQWVFAASLVFPFYDGGVRYGAIRDAELQLAQANEGLELARRRVRLEVREALRRVASAERTARIAVRQAEVARRVAQAAEARYAQGAVTGLELDDARRRAEQADLSRILAELELSNARVDLLTVTGAL